MAVGEGLFSISRFGGQLKRWRSARLLSVVRMAPGWRQGGHVSPLSMERGLAVEGVGLVEGGWPASTAHVQLLRREIALGLGPRQVEPVQRLAQWTRVHRLFRAGHVVGLLRQRVHHRADRFTLRVLWIFVVMLCNHCGILSDLVQSAKIIKHCEMRKRELVWRKATWSTKKRDQSWLCLKNRTVCSSKMERSRQNYFPTSFCQPAIVKFYVNCNWGSSFDFRA